MFSEETIGAESELFAKDDTFDFGGIGDSLESLKTLATRTYINSAPQYSPSQEQELISRIPGIPGTKGAEKLLDAGLRSGVPNIAAFTGGFYTGQADALKAVKENLLAKIEANRTAREVQDKAFKDVLSINNSQIALANSKRAAEVAKINKQSTLLNRRNAERSADLRERKLSLEEEKFAAKNIESALEKTSKTVAGQILKKAWDDSAGEKDSIARWNKMIDIASSNIDPADKTQVDALAAGINQLKSVYFGGIKPKPSPANLTGLSGKIKKPPEQELIPTKPTGKPDKNSLLQKKSAIGETSKARAAAEMNRIFDSSLSSLSGSGLSRTEQLRKAAEDARAKVDTSDAAMVEAFNFAIGKRNQLFDNPVKPLNVSRETIFSPRSAAAAELTNEDIGSFDEFVSLNGFSSGKEKIVAESLAGVPIADRQSVVSAITTEANSLNIDPALVGAVISAESGGNPAAVSSKGALGLMQVMPSTFKSVMPEGDPTDPKDNVIAGTRYLSKMVDRFGSLPIAIAAYNAGPNRKWPEALRDIPETKAYVVKVMDKYNEATGSGPTIAEMIAAGDASSPDEAAEMLINKYIVESNG